MKILWIYQNALEVAGAFNTEWESEFGKNFPIGSSAQIKLPQRWLVTNGLGYQPQGIARLATTVNLDQVFGIHFEWDSYERLVKMERSESELEENYLKPAGVQLAQETDSRAAYWASLYTSNYVGTLGTDSTTIAPFTAAERILYQKALAKGVDRKLCLSPTAMEAYVKNNVTQFNPASEIARMYKTGVIGTAAGWEWYRSNSLYSLTCGTWAAHSNTVSGANQSGSTITIADTAADVINPGDKFTIAGVYAVNPVTRRQIGTQLQQFTYTGTTALTLTGTDAIPVYPPIYGPGSQYQNVTALPANSAAITVWSTSGTSGTVSLGLSKWAFAIAGGKFETPKAVERAEQTVDPETGMSVRFIRAWDQHESKMTNRFDMNLGFGNLLTDAGAVAVLGA